MMCGLEPQNKDHIEPHTLGLVTNCPGINTGIFFSKKWLKNNGKKIPISGQRHVGQL